MIVSRKYFNTFLFVSVALITGLAIVGNAKADLVAQWDFDNVNNVGQATQGSDLTAVGNAAYSASGKVGGALQLDGAGDFLHLAGDALPTGIPAGDSSFTIAAFIKTSAVNYRNGIVGWGGANNGQFNGFRTARSDDVAIPGGDGLVHYSWGSDAGYDALQPATIANGVWHHVAVTYDSATSTKQLYLDGAALGGAVAVASNLSVAADNFRLGTIHHSAGDEDFNGLLDRVQIYNSALTGVQVASLASVPEPSTLALLVAGSIGLLAYAWRKRK
jgi:hypothetical protein